MLQEERFLRIRSLLATFSRVSVDRIGSTTSTQATHGAMRFEHHVIA